MCKYEWLLVFVCLFVALRWTWLVQGVILPSPYDSWERLQQTRATLRSGRSGCWKQTDGWTSMYCLTTCSILSVYPYASRWHQIHFYQLVPLNHPVILITIIFFVANAWKRWWQLITSRWGLPCIHRYTLRNYAGNLSLSAIKKIIWRNLIVPFTLIKMILDLGL